ncbi:MAG: phage N-6-adenine-methyltransferase [Alteromonas sp.]|nr:MAG: phage N-6-adenine-methyltransferase [Alteromonas sp.]
MSNDLWSTPPEVFNALDMEFGFGFDVCAEDETAKCAEYWTIDQNALVQDWGIAGSMFGAGYASYLWCNPPYSKILPWVVKAIEAQAAGRGTVMLVMCDPSVKWFSLAAQYASEIRFVTEGRLAFLKNGKPQSGNNKGSAIFVFDPHRIGAGYVSFVTRETLLSKGKVNALEVAA